MPVQHCRHIVGPSGPGRIIPTRTFAHSSSVIASRTPQSSPQYLAPSRRPPHPIWRNRKRDKSPRPAEPRLTPGEMRIAQTVIPDAIYIDSVKWFDLATEPPYQGSVPSPGGSYPPYVQPHDSLLVNYRLWKGLMRYSEAIAIARVADGVTMPVHIPIQLPPFALGAADQKGSIELHGWPTPFPNSLYGFHQLIIELWWVTGTGQPLPLELQISPPDPRLFQRASSDWCWLFVSPVCKGQPNGVEFLKLNSASIDKTAVQLDSTGQNIAANQILTVSWNYSSAGLPATSYGYQGSLFGVMLAYSVSGLYVEFPPLPVSQGQLDLSGQPWQPGAFVYVTAGGASCGDVTWKQFPLTTPAQKPTPADLVANYITLTPTDFPRLYEPFAAFFQISNAGGTATPGFQAALELQSGASSTVYGPLLCLACSHTKQRHTPTISPMVCRRGTTTTSIFTWTSEELSLSQTKPTTAPMRIFMSPD